MSFITDTFFGGAEKKAARARAAGITEGISEQQRQSAQTRRDFEPTIAGGQAAADQEAAFLGLQGKDAEQAAIDSFIESPGQAFLRQRAERALTRNAAALGGLRGGNVLTALQEQGIGIAAGQLGERKDRLSMVANRGVNALSNRAGLESGYSANIANLQAGRGDVLGSGIEAQAAGRRSGLSMIAGAFTGSGKLPGFGAIAPKAGVGGVMGGSAVGNFSNQVPPWFRRGSS